MKHHEAVEFCKSLAKQIDNSFKQQYKFEGAIVSGINDDNMSMTTRGYNENPLNGLSTTSRERPQSGDFVIQMNSNGAGGLPLNLGVSDWFTG